MRILLFEYATPSDSSDTSLENAYKEISKSAGKLDTIQNVAALCFLLLTLANAGRYGFYGDELNYFACSKHLGYVDHPPLVAFLTLIGTWVFGETIIGLRSLSGNAGAIDHSGPKHSLPQALCPRNSSWMWGTHTYTGQEVLSVGYDSHFLEQFFDSVIRVGCVHNPYAYDVDLYLCREPKAALERMWPNLKRYL